MLNLFKRKIKLFFLYTFLDPQFLLNNQHDTVVLNELS